MDVQCATRLMENCTNQSSQHLHHPAVLRLHCHSVSYAAHTIAEKLSMSGMIVDPNITAVMGMLHDVGRSKAGDQRHGVEGFWIVQEAGFSANIARVCVTHLTMGRTAKEAITSGLLSPVEAHTLEDLGTPLENMTLEEQIVGMVDSRVLGGRFVSMEERISELNKRKGQVLPDAQYNLDRITELAATFEQVLGYSLDQLFPEGKLEVMLETK